MGGGHVYSLGVSAARHQRAYRVTGRPALYSGADFGDMAGNLEARCFTGAGWRWIETQALHHVGPVHPCRHHVDGYFPRAGCGQVGYLRPLHDLGIAKTVERYRIHAVVSLCRRLHRLLSSSVI
ncbi:Uncharacterised protein [Mycobacteroides abscessus subsp. abscessus]|nr:Uncharacterised protein [Mycobacteroides abscessus subsp. abscessus]